MSSAVQQHQCPGLWVARPQSSSQHPVYSCIHPVDVHMYSWTRCHMLQLTVWDTTVCHVSSPLSFPLVVSSVSYSLYQEQSSNLAVAFWQQRPSRKENRKHSSSQTVTSRIIFDQFPSKYVQWFASHTSKLGWVFAYRKQWVVRCIVSRTTVWSSSRVKQYSVFMWGYGFDICHGMENPFAAKQFQESVVIPEVYQMNSTLLQLQEMLQPVQVLCTARAEPVLVGMGLTWECVSPVSTSVTFTVEWTAETCGTVFCAEDAVLPWVKPAELIAVLDDGPDWGGDGAEGTVGATSVSQVLFSYQPSVHQSESSVQ